MTTLLNFSFKSFVVLSLLVLSALSLLPLFLTYFNAVFDFLSGGQNVVSSEHFTDTDTWLQIKDALIFTIKQAALSAFFSVLLAWLFARNVFFKWSRFSHSLMKLSSIPFGLPSIIICFGLIAAFGNSGIVNRSLSVFEIQIPFLYNEAAIVAAHVFFNFGMCSMLIYARYNSIPVEHWKTSELLNLNSKARLMSVEWPQLKGTLLNLFMLVFSFCLTSFAIVLTLGGTPNLTTLEVLIFQLIRYDSNLASALLASSVQMLFLLLFALALYFSSKSTESSSLSTEGAKSAQSRFPTLYKEQSNFAASFKLKTYISSSASLALRLLIILFVLLPIGALVKEALGYVWAKPNEALLFLKSDELLISFIQSLLVAVPVAIISSGCATILAIWVARHTEKGKQAAIVEVLTFALIAISPTVLGFSWFSNFLDWQFNPFDYSWTCIVAIQAFLFAPISFRVIYPEAKRNFKKWKSNYKILSLPVGIQSWRIEVPALKVSIASAFLISFAFSLGEVSIPALFGGSDFNPLALLLLDLMGSYEFTKASLVSMLLFLTTGTFMFLGLKGRRNAAS